MVRGRCGVTYYDEFYHHKPELHHMADSPVEIEEPAPTSMGFFEEEIEVSEVDLYERLTIPKFDEVEETVVWHDFEKVGSMLLGLWLLRRRRSSTVWRT